MHPSELVLFAKEQGVTMLALTDHDTLDGYYLAKQTADDIGIKLICGVEISTTYTIKTNTYAIKANKHKNSSQKIIHIVGLNIQNTAKMQETLSAIQLKRADRGRKMVEKLGQMLPAIGFETLWALSLQRANNNPKALGRVHIAWALCKLGVVKSTQEAFDSYLSDRQCAYVAIETLTMAQAIKLIDECGGIAVLAHPTRYKLSATCVRKLIDDFWQLGGQACELPDVSEPISTRQMIDRAVAKYKLWVSVGSDFHGTITPWRKLGQVPTPKSDQVGVWQRFG